MSPVESSPILSATTSSMRRPGTTSNLYGGSRHGSGLSGRWGGGRTLGIDDRSDKYMNFDEFRHNQNKAANNNGSGRSLGYGQSNGRNLDLNGGGSTYERGRGSGARKNSSLRQRW